MGERPAARSWRGRWSRGLRKLIHTRLARGEEAELERPGAGALALA